MRQAARECPLGGAGLSHDSTGNRPVSKVGVEECGPREVEIPLDAELVELILSWPTLSKEIQQQIMLLGG